MRLSSPRLDRRLVFFTLAAAALVAAALVSAGVLRNAESATTPTIALDMDPSTPGIQSNATYSTSTDPIAIDVVVLDAQETGAFEFIFAYDALFIEFIGYNIGPWLGSTGRTLTCRDIITENTVRIGCNTSLADPPGPSGDGLLATLFFRPKIGGDPCLTLLLVETASVLGEAIITQPRSGCLLLVDDTPTPTGTITPSATPSPSATASPTAVASATATSTASPSATASPTATLTPSPSASPSPTGTATASATASPTATTSATATPTNSPTSSPTTTNTATATASPTRTATASATASPTSSSTATSTPVATFTPTRTATRTAIATATGAAGTRTPAATSTAAASTRTPGATATLAPHTVTPAATSTPRSDVCRSPGYWSSHPGAWPKSTLTLGDYTYTKHALLMLLKMPARGDASLIMLRHLVAAELNLASGESSPAYARAAHDAGLLLTVLDRPVPLGIRAWTPLGQWFIVVTIRLHLHHAWC
jgi:hypothetical protein